jgi:hypothetical protein
MSVGVFAVHRGVFDHPIFAPEPYTEREAWIWMLSAAAWKDTRVRVGTTVYDLKRGELVFATRFLAERWKWNHSRVVRFLKKLKTETMVNTLATRDATHITICKYEEYQFGGNADETPTETQTETETKRQRNKEEEDNNLRTKNSIGAEKKSRKKPARPMPDIFPASEAMRAYAEKRGYKFEIPPCFAFNKTRPGPAQTMFEAFKNHHGAKGSQFADWDAAWRTWVDNQAKWDTERGKPPGLRPAI